MSIAPNLIELPVDRIRVAEDPLSHDLLEDVALANGAAAGMRRLVDRVRRAAQASGVDWWGLGDGGALTRIVTTGTARGPRTSVSLDRAGTLAIFGGRVDDALETALAHVAPVIRRRVNEERLAGAAARLARRNEALDEFASLVAHELKTPLQGALEAAEPKAVIRDALDLVDVLLEAEQTSPVARARTDVAQPLDRAVRSLDRPPTVTTDLSVPLPLAPGPLFVILRNLVSNAGSAGADNVHVKTERSQRGSRLVVDDDGAGVQAADRYATGSRIGLPLCRRIAARSNGVLELKARVPKGTSALLTFDLAPA
jgi:signal transduction histidine kinase